jgi:AAA domain-containing protein
MQSFWWQPASDGLTIDDVNPVWMKTPAAPIVGSVMEEVNIDIEQIIAAFGGLQARVDHVVVEGVGGWMVPIRSDYFLSDLAVQMKLPVLVVAVATLTSDDFLRKIVNIPLFDGLGKTLMELPADWRLMIDSTKSPSVLTTYKSVKK